MPLWERKSDVDVESCLANLDRLAALNHSGWLDAEPRDDLDALTQSAATELDAPIALVSLVDDRRQFFAADVGFSGYLSESRQTSLDYSYCKHVVAQQSVLAVENSLTDELVKDNLATTELGVRSYLGVPLHKNGHVLGSLCVIDMKPRTWTDEDVASLRVLADEVMSKM